MLFSFFAAAFCLATALPNTVRVVKREDAIIIGKRQTVNIPTTFTDIPSMVTVANQVSSGISSGQLKGNELTTTMKRLYQAAQPLSTPTSVRDAMQKSFSMFNLQDNGKNVRNLLASSLGLMMNGFTSDTLRRTINEGDNVPTYNNAAVPENKNFYRRAGNAPFSVPEEQLRSAIDVPEGLANSQKLPVLMCPGTGAIGVETFGSNMGKLLANSNFAVPVYLSVPQHLLGDVQVNAEYVAYAAQYLNAITNKKIGIVTWSQGSIDTQWAFKYWPSVRNVTTDHVAVSGDYDGTQLAYLLCPGLSSVNNIACTPSILQQTYFSRLINQLRRTDGDSAYVPTTTIFSAVDEIVQPQFGSGASAFIKDSRGVGVSNNYLQDVCAFQTGSGFYLHEGVLYSATAYALVVDALTHDGPADINRVRQSCSQSVPAGITPDDVIETEAIIPTILFRAIGFDTKSVQEPPIKSYATY